jgi:hypothetical protein
MLILNVLQIGSQHFYDDFRLAHKQQGVLCDKEVSALIAKTGNIYAAAAG